MASAKPSFVAQLNRGHHLSRGVVFAAPCHEGGGAQRADVSGRDEHLGTFGTAPTWAGGISGWCNTGHTTGVGLQTANNVLHGIGTGDFTMAVSVMPTAIATGTYQHAMGVGLYVPGIYLRGTGAAQWNLYWGGDHYTGVALSNGLWYRLVVRRTGSTVEYFTDGSKAATSHTIATSMADAKVNIGKNQNGNEPMFGSTDNFVLWNRALSDAEIAEDAADPFAMYREDPFVFTTASTPIVSAIFNFIGKGMKFIGRLLGGGL